MPNFISEDNIEQAMLQSLQHLHGFDVLDCHTAKPEELNDGSNRTDKRDVILADRLRAACLRLNPQVPVDVIDTKVMPLITDRRSAMSPINANRELYGFIRDGVPVFYEDANGVKQQELVQLTDFSAPNPNEARNHYLAVQQLWVKSTVQAPQAAYRRPDVILYVNGLPLVFIELKNSNIKLRSAYDDNVVSYKNDIPQLFHCNVFCVLSNAIDTKVGSFTAGWEHFFNWLRVEDEKEAINRSKISSDGVTLERLVNGLCAPEKLLDYAENFVLFHKETSKIIAQNHQFMGVNQAFERFTQRENLRGKLGVFWHTQGSGKSFSMIFYVRKILRKLTGNFSFVVITDRSDLDGQIYRNFLNTETVKESEMAQPK
ncbi:MAG: type I restriction endonuclease subunit R, partial [Moraxellaceae bacterium]